MNPLEVSRCLTSRDRKGAGNDSIFPTNLPTTDMRMMPCGMIVPPLRGLGTDSCGNSLAQPHLC